jgi:Ca2+-binding RTX toxin-like protein
MLFGYEAGTFGDMVSTAGDVDGDGFDDLIVSNFSGDGPDGNRSNAGESYLLFGSATLGDYETAVAVTHQGTDGNDTLIGSGDDIMIGGRGNDDLRGGPGGMDVLVGGQGNDVLTIGDFGGSGTNFRRIDGGTGNDVLAFNGAIDMTDAAFRRISDIEGLRLGNGPTDITLGPIAARAINGQVSGAVQAAAADDFRLTIDGALATNVAVTIDASAFGRPVTINVSNNSGVATLTGGTGADVFTGGSTGDALIGNGGNDTLNGRGGDDTLTGGAGSDTVVFAPGYDRDTFTDMAAGAGLGDAIDLTAFSTVRSLNHVLARATQQGADTVIDFGNGDTLTLSNVNRANLVADDFIFGSAAQQPAPRDFNGDAMSDILWRHSGGTTVVWEMNGGQKLADVNLNAIPTDWTIQGTGDFNGDGKSGDIVWRHTNGTTVIWAMDGATKLFDLNLNFIPNEWSIKGIGDFNGDGKSDILWRHDNGTSVIWAMDGATKLFDLNLNFIPTTWKIQGLGDFNGDGKSDILWRHDNGTSVIWSMDGATKLFDLNLNAIPTSWHIRGLGDFNGDGKSDIVWRHDNGTTVLWLMDGAQKLADANLNAIPNDWSIRGIGDFNGDGNSDILWRHDNGTTVMWAMDGAARLFDVNLNAIPNDWSIFQPQHDIV